MKELIGAIILSILVMIGGCFVIYGFARSMADINNAKMEKP